MANNVINLQNELKNNVNDQLKVQQEKQSKASDELMKDLDQIASQQEGTDMGLSAFMEIPDEAFLQILRLFLEE